ncbi:MAG TPA: D-cysteine desulfhydrase family protein [Anaerolineales bacterium]
MKKLPRIRMAHLPTAVEKLPRLSAALGGPTLLVKRDDQTGLAFGGNKTRKLEFLVAEAQRQGARTLITAGAVQSNHCRQTAAAAARYGFDCLLVLAGERPERASGNLLLDHLLGAGIVWAGGENREEVLQNTYQEAFDAGQKPYLIPYGGSNPTGAAAYAFALQEMLEQGVRPDAIVFASSSGGTQAGLLAGARIFGFEGRVLGISVDERAGALRARVATLASQTAEILGENIVFRAGDVWVNDDFLGAGYGVMGEIEEEAIKLFARTEGLLLDPVYTGRAAAGLVSLIREGIFAAGQSVLFWHTGGTPALFAERYRNLAG